MSDVTHRMTQMGRHLAGSLGLSASSVIRRYCYAKPQRLEALPRTTRDRFRLSPPPIGHRNIELGSGYRPTPGYIHVDIARRPHVEFLIRSHKLPFADAWAD